MERPDLSTVDNMEKIQRHLDRVSRSFAFCIRQLPEPLRLWIGVSYLLCRIVDTIEDSEFKALEDQKRAFDWFDQNISDLQPDHFSYPSELWPVDATEGERLLLSDAAFLFETFWSMSPRARESVSKLAHSMSLGMRHFRFRASGPLKLKDLKEVNQYCFFVAGLVGEMLAGFIAQVEPRFTLHSERLIKAHHFGLFLQKVNLLKDQLKDQKLGRFLVPSREGVENSAGQNADQALQFLTDLPLEQVEFRRFCAWSLFMGLASLRKKEKLTRDETQEVIQSVEENLQDNQGLLNLFINAAQALGWKAFDSQGQDSKKPAEIPPWFLNLYKGQLPPERLVSLGIS